MVDKRERRRHAITLCPLAAFEERRKAIPLSFFSIISHCLIRSRSRRVSEECVYHNNGVHITSRVCIILNTELLTQILTPLGFVT